MNKKYVTDRIQDIIAVLCHEQREEIVKPCREEDVKSQLNGLERTHCNSHETIANRVLLCNRLKDLIEKEFSNPSCGLKAILIGDLFPPSDEFKKLQSDHADYLESINVYKTNLRKSIQFCMDSLHIGLVKEEDLPAFLAEVEATMKAVLPPIKNFNLKIDVTDLPGEVKFKSIGPEMEIISGCDGKANLTNESLRDAGMDGVISGSRTPEQNAKEMTRRLEIKTLEDLEEEEICQLESELRPDALNLFYIKMGFTPRDRVICPNGRSLTVAGLCKESSGWKIAVFNDSAMKTTSLYSRGVLKKVS